MAAFYGFFHCWLNGFAELLRFGDRMFYEVGRMQTGLLFLCAWVMSRIGGI